MIEYETLKAVVPKNQRDLITPDLVDRLNSWGEDPLLVDTFRENLVSYVGVLRDGKYKLEDYINAVRFVSYKLLGHTDIDAYAITFPKRYATLEQQGLTRDEMSPYTSAYKKNKLVNAIMEQTLVPSYVLNAPLHQEALNTLAHIMVKGRSETARVNAAIGILSATKQPENSKITIDLGVDSKDAISELRQATEALALAQQEQIRSGVSVRVIAESRITEAEVCDD